VIELAASETTIVVIIVSAVGALLTTAIVIAVFFVAFEPEEDSVKDVHQFVQLTEEARSLLAHGHGSGDPGVSDIARFQAKKDEARKALWASARRRAA